MSTSGLPDIQTLNPRAAGPRAMSVYFSQTMSAHGITTMQHLCTLTLYGIAPSSSNLVYKCATICEHLT